MAQLFYHHSGLTLIFLMTSHLFYFYDKIFFYFHVDYLLLILAPYLFGLDNMRMDWKRVLVVYIIIVLGWALLLTPVAMAAGSGNGSSAGQGGSGGGTSGSSSSGQSESTSITGGHGAGSASGRGGATQAPMRTTSVEGYWPAGPASAVPAQNDQGAHHKGWIGGSMNPWVLGGKNLGIYGAGNLRSLAWPGEFYSPGYYWHAGWPPIR